jgi:Mn2+/Fe2+ NRAMP family transporter
MKTPGAKNWFSMIAPGVLIAATGVGAGDLVTAGLAGSRLGLTIVWAVLLGALMKWFLNEGLARWQLGTNTSLLQAWSDKLGLSWVFLVYLVIWSFGVGGALISAAGIAGLALVPIFDGGDVDKRVWGIAHSWVAVVLVFCGGYRLFEKLMSVCIGVMFLAVTFCAIRLLPQLDYSQISFVNPLSLRGNELKWTISLIGGVGGTVTLLSSGYWILEERRSGADGVALCRLDLGVGYTMTALFGVGMIIIAHATPGLSGQGAQMLVVIADGLGQSLGGAARLVFLVGAWGAIFSSMLGVWQGVPYLFADLVGQIQKRHARNHPPAPPLTRTRAYRFFLLFLAVPPITLLWAKVAAVQLAYTISGALFVPLLAGSLLLLNNRRELPREFRSGWIVNTALVLTLLFFVWTGATALIDKPD